MNATIKIVLVVVGFVGLADIVAAAKFGRRVVSRRHGFLRLHWKDSLDVVVTASMHQDGGVPGQEYKRAVTAVGNLEAAITVAQAVAQSSRRRRMRVAASQELQSRLDGDLLVLGLPAKNPVSERILSHLVRCHPELGLGVTQTPARSEIRLGGSVHGYELVFQHNTRIPTHDLAIIVVWVNPLPTRKRRLILCAGFTSQGTAAAAAYLVNELMKRYKRARREYRGLPSLYFSRKWPCFVSVIESHFEHDQPVEFKVMGFELLTDPGCPPIEEGK